MNIRNPLKIMLFLSLMLALTGGCASQGPPEQGKLIGPGKSVTADTSGVYEIVLEFPAGDVQVVSTSGSHAGASLEIRCEERNKSCVRLAETVELKQQIFENRMYISTSTRSKFSFRNAQSDYRVQVPENIPLRIIMGYGSLSVKGLHSDLTIDMSAGEIKVEAPRSAIRRVWADANFGDANLHGTGSGSEGNRRLLVGAEADWQEGTGDHDIVVDLNAGDITVILTPD